MDATSCVINASIYCFVEEPHMKKLFCFIIIGLVAFSAQAQERLFYSVEVAAGAGIGRGPQVEVSPQFVAQYGLTEGFNLGVGAGIRYARPCFQYITKNGGTRERSFCNEFDIPVFLRLGYGKEMFFANVDAGYAIDLEAYYDSDWIPGGETDACYNGFFVEPHIGMKLGQHSAVSLGVLLQQSVVSNHTYTESGTMGPSLSITEKVTKQNRLTPAFTLRYAFRF